MSRRATISLALVSLGSIAPLGLLVSAHAASRVIQVTPENLASGDIRFRVEAESYDNDSIFFRVFVSGDSTALSPRREGRLEIAPEGPGGGASGPRPQPVLWCSVREISQDGVLEYEFGLPQGWLSRATFMFRNYHPRMPSMDEYDLRLERFAPSGPVHSSQLQTAYDVEPVLVSMQDPVYPESAKQKGISGTVLVRVLVGEDGRVQDTLVIQSVPLLDEAAVAAARTAAFEPARKDDRPVAVWMVIPVEYRLHP